MIKGRYVWDERDGKQKVSVSLVGTEAHVLQGLSQCVDVKEPTNGSMIETVM